MKTDAVMKALLGPSPALLSICKSMVDQLNTNHLASGHRRLAKNKRIGLVDWLRCAATFVTTNLVHGPQTPTKTIEMLMVLGDYIIQEAAHACISASLAHQDCAGIQSRS